MNTEKICEKTSRCPIYSGVLQSNEMLTRTYKSLFCENGAEGRAKCRRYQVAEIMGFCPPNILPNSTRSAQDIAAGLKHLPQPAAQPGMSCSRSY